MVERAFQFNVHEKENAHQVQVQLQEVENMAIHCVEMASTITSNDYVFGRIVHNDSTAKMIYLILNKDVRSIASGVEEDYFARLLCYYQHDEASSVSTRGLSVTDCQVISQSSQSSHHHHHYKPLKPALIHIQPTLQCLIQDLNPPELPTSIKSY